MSCYVFPFMQPQQQIDKLNSTIWKLIDHFGMRNTATRLSIEGCQVYKTNFGKVVCASRDKMNYAKAKEFCEQLNTRLATGVVRDETERQ